jgi:hypothetical protein
VRLGSVAVTKLRVDTQHACTLPESTVSCRSATIPSLSHEPCRPGARLGAGLSSGGPLGDYGDPSGLGRAKPDELTGHARNSTGAGGGLWEGLRQLGDDEDVGDPDPLKNQATKDSSAQQASSHEATRQQTDEVDDQE